MGGPYFSNLNNIYSVLLLLLLFTVRYSLSFLSSPTLSLSGDFWYVTYSTEFSLSGPFFRVVRTSLPLHSPDGQGTHLITTSATLGMRESYNTERTTGSRSSSKGPYRSTGINSCLYGPVLQHLALQSVKSKFSWITNSIAYPSGHAVSCVDSGFESHRRHWSLCLVSVVCCQAEVSASGCSLVRRSPTECGVSECDHEASKMGRLFPTRGSCGKGKTPFSRALLGNLIVLHAVNKFYVP